MSNTPRLIIAGAGGRMGRAVISEALRAQTIPLGGGFDHPESEAVGADIGLLAGRDALGVLVAGTAANCVEAGDVIVDFTAPQATLANAKLAVSLKAPIVIGTTGFTPADEKTLHDAAQHIPIVKSGNMSLGVNLLAALVEMAAQKLGNDYDIEVVEAHHRRKIDAPSGTALLLGEAAATGRDVSLDDKAVYTRQGQTGARNDGDIGFAVIRGGGIIGDHDVKFVSDEEVISLSHRALDRSLFARGAVKAAEWVIGKPPGMYDMHDVLGLTS